MIEISNVTKGGYDYGFMTIQGLGKFSGKMVKVLFLNENAVAHETADENTDATKDNIIATTPDVIAGITKRLQIHKNAKLNACKQMLILYLESFDNTNMIITYIKIFYSTRS